MRRKLLRTITLQHKKLGTVPFNYQLVKEIRRENIVRILFKNSDRKSVPVLGPKTKDAPGPSPRYYGAPLAMAVYTMGQV